MGPRGRRGRGQREILGNNTVISEVSVDEAEIDHYDGPSERRGRPGSSGATSGSRTIRASSRHRSASREAQPAKIREETNNARNMLLRNVDFGGECVQHHGRGCKYFFSWSCEMICHFPRCYQLYEHCSRLRISQDSLVSRLSPGGTKAIHVHWAKK